MSDLENFLKNPTSELPSPLLILGGSRKERIDSVFALAKKALQRECQSHPDLLIFSPDEKSKTYQIESLRQINNELNLPPFEAEVRFFCLEEVDRMLPVHQNTLLKSLEEHLPFSKIFLLASTSQSILPTILSRTVELRLKNEEPRDPINVPWDLPPTLFFQEAERIDKEGIDLNLILESYLRYFPEEEAFKAVHKASIASQHRIKTKYILEFLYLLLPTVSVH